MESDDSVLAWAAIDFLCALLLVLYVLIAPSQKPPAIQTYGSWAITLTWPSDRHDDLDLWTQLPTGELVWFGHLTAGDAHLEHDDLATGDSGYKHGPNFERVILRGVIPGEYVVVVHVYSRDDVGKPIPATVQLWSLLGQDRLVRTQRLMMHGQGDEQTAMRVTLRGDKAFGFSRLPKDLVGMSR